MLRGRRIGGPPSCAVTSLVSRWTLTMVVTAVHVRLPTPRHRPHLSPSQKRTACPPSPARPSSRCSSTVSSLHPLRASLARREHPPRTDRSLPSSVAAHLAQPTSLAHPHPHPHPPVPPGSPQVRPQSMALHHPRPGRPCLVLLRSHYRVRMDTAHHPGAGLARGACDDGGGDVSARQPRAGAVILVFGARPVAGGQK